MKMGQATAPVQERRRYPRFYITTRMTLAIEDESLSESLGLGEPGDISFGGLRVKNLPACQNVQVGDRLGLLLMDQEDALSLHGDVVHHGTPDTFGVEFRDLTASEQKSVVGIIARLNRQTDLSE